MRRPNANQMFSKALSGAGDQLTKRLTLAGLTLSSSAGGQIPVKAYAASLCQSSPAAEWASFAARYQQYRVRAIRVTGKAIQPVQLSTVSHSVLHLGDFIGSATPGTDAQVFSDENVKEIGTYQNFSYTADWKRNPNAKLWNPTSAVVPVANDYSVVVSSPAAPALAAATTYWAVSIEWDVEFRGSQ
jgi:hypothetical protein